MYVCMHVYTHTHIHQPNYSLMGPYTSVDLSLNVLSIER
jgi:hypothetical protein